MTPIEYIPAKTIVTRAKGGGWFGIDYNMNIYRGCCHGCIYCDSRSECYHIEEFDRVRAKADALRLIRDDLRRKVKTGVVGTGAMSDPYNPYEKDLLLTRHALELIHAYDFGVVIASKSDLITRDIDVLCNIREHSPVLCKITVTTCDDGLANRIEPGAPSPSRRLEAVKQLSDAGIFTGVLLMPVLPFLEDSPENIREVIKRAAGSGARFIYPAFGMTLRQNQRDWYYQKLDELFPEEKLREQYQRTFGEAYECRSPKAKKLWYMLKDECEKLGLCCEMQDIVRASRTGYGDSQLSFF